MPFNIRFPFFAAIPHRPFLFSFLPSFLPSFLFFFLFLWQNWMFSSMKEGYGPRKIIRNAARLGRVNKADAKYTRSLNALSWRCSISRTRDLKGFSSPAQWPRPDFVSRATEAGFRSQGIFPFNPDKHREREDLASPPLTIEVTSSS